MPFPVAVFKIYLNFIYFLFGFLIFFLIISLGLEKNEKKERKMKELLYDAIDALAERKRYTKKAQEHLFGVFGKLSEKIHDEISLASDHNVRCKWSYYINGSNLIEKDSFHEIDCNVAVQDGRVALIARHYGDSIMESAIIEEDEIDYINIRDAVNGLKQLLEKIINLETNRTQCQLLGNVLHTLELE